MSKSPENKVFPIHQTFLWGGADEYNFSVIEKNFKYEDFSLYPHLIKYPSGMKNIAEAHKEIVSLSFESMANFGNYDPSCFISQFMHFVEDDSYGLSFFYNPSKISTDQFTSFLKSSINNTNCILSNLGNSNRIQPL